MEERKLTALIVAAAGVVAVGLMGTCAMLVVGARKRANQPPTAGPEPESSPPPDGPSPQGRAAARDAPGVPGIPVKDPWRADLADLVPLAHAEARSKNAGAKFVGINAFALKNGVVDIPARGLGKDVVLFEFEYSGFDKSKPPGQDKVEGRVTVHITKDGFHTSDSPGTALHLRPDGFFGGPLERPGCRSAKMWARAVKSGVPENSVARITLQDNKKWTPDHPLIWKVWVDGHDELNREIDAMTCKVIDKDQKGGGEKRGRKKRDRAR